MGGAVAEKYVGSVVDELPSKSAGPHPPGVTVWNTTGSSMPKGPESSGLNSYIIIVAIVGTILPLFCIIITIILARRLWVKYRSEGYEGYEPKLERDETCQTSIKSREGSRKSSRASRVTKDPNSRDQLIPQDSMITSPSEGPVTEEAGDTIEEIIVGDPEGDLGTGEIASKVSVSMKNHNLVVEVEGAPNLPDTPTITENGKTHLLTEAQVEPVVTKLGGDLLKATHLPVSGELGVYLKRSKSERVRPRVTTATKDESVGDLGVTDAIEHISPRPHHRRLSMGHHPHAHHATPQRLTVEPESGNFGLSTSDLSLDSNSSCNPSYKYGNQVSYAGGYYGYPVSQGYPQADARNRRMHLVVPRASSGASDDSHGAQREKVDRKTSLPNSLETHADSKGSLSPSRCLSTRGALSKQYSLPASARNARYTPRHRHSFRHDRPHQYQQHDHAFDHPPHVRSHSASLHAPHDHRPHVPRELHSPRVESPHHMPRELHSPRLESPHVTRELHSPRHEKAVTPVPPEEKDGAKKA
ncbi:uncharacterized protein [Penaeus vannamei]|uniref:uncharacterized protein isoform X2 n=1 Tax=Penaeus vannamei TaxID=6689 RepID=UPI00387FA921